MDLLQLQRLGHALREMRSRRSLTQAELARLAGVDRRKVIQAEQGDASVSIRAYAAIALALGAELTCVPSRRPSLEEAREFFAHEE